MLADLSFAKLYLMFHNLRGYPNYVILATLPALNFIFLEADFDDESRGRRARWPFPTALHTALPTTNLIFQTLKKSAAFLYSQFTSAHLLPLRYHVEFDDGFDNIIVVDGVPIIDKSKLDKLLTKISKEFSRRGAVIKPDDIFVPWDDHAGKTKGYACISPSARFIGSKEA